MRTLWNFFSPGQLVFGEGSSQELGRLLLGRHLERVFLVTDPRLVQAGIVGRVEDTLRESGIVVECFAEGEAEPAMLVALAGAAKAKSFGPQAIVGLGGGSNMDLAKMIAVLVTHGGDVRRYFGFNNVPGPVIPLVCLPTTAGTGSEVSHAAVLTDTDNQIKVSTLSQFLRPALAIVDPCLTWSCPKQVTADSGIDALTHAIEALMARHHTELGQDNAEPLAYEGSHPLATALAEQAIALVGKHLKAAVLTQDRAAREGMSLAATLAGLAFSSSGVALVHGLEYPIGGAVHVSHGAGNGLLLPFVMRFNKPVRLKELARIAELLGVKVAGLSAEEAAEQGILAVEQLKEAIGIPLRLRDLGVREDQLQGLAEKAYAIKRLRDVNPRESSVADLAGILSAAF